MPTLNARPTRPTATRTDRVARFGSSPRFATIVLDVDSTLCGIEGFDWLAQRRGEIVARRVTALTDDAMHGAKPLEEIYAARLAMIRPRRDDVDALARAYAESLAPGAVETLSKMRRAGVHVVLMSCALRHALVRLAFHLGIDLEDVHAVDIRFDAVGAYTGFDSFSVLTATDGKAEMLSRLTLDGPVLAVGDSVTDVAMRSVCGQVAAFTGFVRRDAALAEADYTVSSFADLATLVLG